MTGKLCVVLDSHVEKCLGTFFSLGGKEVLKV